MSTTSEVLNQHLKCFGENDLVGVLADYSSDVVFFIPGRALTRSSPFSRHSFLSLRSLAPHFRCDSNALKVNTPTSCGALKR